MGHCRENNPKSSKLNILLLPLEFATWQRACHWTYGAQLGFEEGLTSNNVEFFTIPVLQEVPSSSPSSWLYYARQLCGNKKFDQVWLWLIHPQYDEAFLEWVKEIAPIRVGFVMESIEYNKQAFEDNPGLHNVYKERKEILENQLHYMTHILACDEADAEQINMQGVCKALWYSSAVPEKFLATSAVVRREEAVFCGALYGKRGKWLKDYGLKGLLVSKVSDENSTEYPRIFDELNRKMTNFLQQNRTADEALLTDYLNMLRNIRQACFKLWLNGLQTGCAIVNLPHLLKTYAGRVVEAMSAGRPVISWEIPNRPRNRSLFKPGNEILLFDKSKPEQLANHIRHIQDNPNFAQQMAENALQKVGIFHTIEKRIQQVLDWIKTGNEPAFGEIEQNQQFEQDNRRAVFVGANSANQEHSNSLTNIDELFDKLVESGEIAFAEGQYNKAAQLYCNALKYNPNISNLWNKMGYLAMKAGDSTTATKAFTHAQTLEAPVRKAQKTNLLNQPRKQESIGPEFFKQRVNIKTIDERITLFRELCEGKKVLHVGCTDSPIFDPETNLHIQLDKFCRELDGYDIDTQGLELLKQYVPGKYFDDINQIKDSYDIMLVPETIEHIDNVKCFLEQLSKIKFKKCLITAPNSFLPNDNGNHFEADDVYVEYVHPDHNFWFSPYTLKNCIQKFTDWRITQTYLLNDRKMVACLCKSSNVWELNKIPKKAHFYWGNETISFLRYLTVYSFRKLNPDWEINLYIPSKKYKDKITWETGESYDGVSFRGKDYTRELFSLDGINITEINFSSYPFIKDAPENFKSDLFRWYILSHEGGLYSDIDILYFRPMNDLFFNLKENNDVDTATCLQENGHIIGFLLSSQGNPFFSKLLSNCENAFESKIYQSISAPMVNKIYPTTDYISKMFPDLVFYNMPMSVVYAIDHHHIPTIFYSNDLSNLTPETIGIHWYAGNIVSQEFNNELTHENFHSYDNIIVHKIKDIYQ